MKSISVLLLAIFDSLFLNAQDSLFNYEDVFAPFEVVRKEMDESRPYHAVQYLTTLDSTRIKDLDLYGQALMTALCFSGEIEVKEEVCKRFRTAHLGLDEKEKMSVSIQAVPAADVVLRQAKTKEVVIINEAHLYPQHRVFVKSLLPALYKLGYRHLCMEDLTFPDTLQKALFPEKKMGYYIRESCMGDLMREALKLGYRLHAYDVPASKHRDSLAAENVKHIRADYPHDKLLIYCGFSHNMEHRSSACMASCFKRISGIDPLTIDQTVYCERESSGYYEALLKFYAIESPAVLMAGDSIMAMNRNYCDIQIITPPTSYIKGRADWLTKIDRRVLRKIDSQLDSGIIEVYYTDEIRKNEQEAIPIDVFIVKSGKKHNRYLALPAAAMLICKYYDLNYSYLYSIAIPQDSMK